MLEIMKDRIYPFMDDYSDICQVLFVKAHYKIILSILTSLIFFVLIIQLHV